MNRYDDIDEPGVTPWCNQPIYLGGKLIWREFKIYFVSFCATKKKKKKFWGVGAKMPLPLLAVSLGILSRKCVICYK